MLAKVPDQQPDILTDYLFVREIELACRHTRLAGLDLETAVAREDEERLWFALHGLLVAAANVSKLLWPSSNSKERDHARAARLRGGLGVPDDSPLNTVDVRNHFEHFDERLEQWASRAGPKGLGDRLIGPRQAISSISPIVYFRTFEPESYVVSFGDAHVALRPVIAAAHTLEVKAAQLTLPAIVMQFGTDQGDTGSAHRVDPHR
jgi:hypothetical protein